MYEKVTSWGNADPALSSVILAVLLGGYVEEVVGIIRCGRKSRSSLQMKQERGGKARQNRGYQRSLYLRT